MSELVLWLAVERLRGLVSAEESDQRIRSVIEHLEALPGELNRLQLVLKEKTDVGREIQKQVRQIEYLAYRMEDVVEAYRVEGNSRIRRLFMRNNQLTPQTIRSEIENNSEEIRDALLHAVRTKETHLSGKSRIKRLLKRIFMRNAQLTPNIDNNNNHNNSEEILFGIEQDKEQVLKVILASDIPESSSHSGVLVFPIFGVIGSGKSTLAKVIYDEQLAANNFDICIWINIPQQFKNREMLRQIHQQINGRSGHLLYSDEQLLEEIENDLRSKSSLIVLDDLRSIEAWTTLRVIFQRLKQGSRILVTTREESVAAHFPGNQVFHKMRSLNEDNSWDLFTKVLSTSHPEERMLMVRKMVQSCEGVPRLIKELAFYLASKQAHEWRIVSENIQAYVSTFFSTVYCELPDYLRPCFLHLGQFSEDLQIDTEKLFHLWLIEGFLSKTARARGERMIDLSERYLEELAHKNIVELHEEDVPATKKFKACSIVEGTENLCVSWGEQRLFLKIIDLRKDDCSLSSETLPPRIVVYLGNHGLSVGYEVAKNVRSLRVVGGNTKQLNNELIWPTGKINLKDFRVLRTLDFHGIDFQQLRAPGGLSNLVLLRYLSFKGCVLKELPSSIGKFLYLQVLDLRVKESAEMIIPDVLWKMRRLKHLYLPLKFRTQNGEKLQLGNLNELRTIDNFNTRVCRVNGVSDFPKLRFFAAKVEGNFDDLEAITSYMQTASNSLLGSSIDIIDLDCYPGERHSVLRRLLQCQVLRTLYFKGHIGHLPPYDEISQNITQLVFNNSHLKEDPMPTLEKIPKLGVLILSDDAYMGKNLVCSASGFPQLKYLELVNLHLLEKFEVKNTAMPVLSYLKIIYCEKYNHIIPDCLKFRSSGHHLKIILS